MADKRATSTKRRLPIAAAEGRTRVGCLTCALCCTYVAVEINAPTSVKNATEILWHLYHERVSVYRDAGDNWLVQFETRCRHLQDDNKCAIYLTRPHICRDYAADACEVNAEDEGTTFHAPSEFLVYLRERSTRIHRGVATGFLPPAEHLGPYAGRETRRVPSFKTRYARLRAAGAPRG